MIRWKQSWLAWFPKALGSLVSAFTAVLPTPSPADAAYGSGLAGLVP